MKDDVLIKQIDEGVAILSLNRPRQANALNRELFVRLKETLDDLQWDDQVRVVIIAAKGQKAFCAGIDLKERAKGIANFSEEEIRGIAKSYRISVRLKEKELGIKIWT